MAAPLKEWPFSQAGKLFLAVLLLVFSACATRNIVQAPTGRFQVQPSGYNQYTPEQDVELGRQAAAEVNRTMPVLPESNPVTQYIQNLGQQLAVHAPGETKWRFTFHVVNIKEINAFALPGGPIYVNLGTIQAADDEGELAGVMAHEISHVVLRHSTQQASKQAMAQAPLAVLGAIIGRGVTGQLAQTGIALGAQSLFLKYSRDAEREADLLGSQIMYDASFTPYSMVEFFSKLEKQGGPGVPQFLSDHPNPGNRVENVRQAIAKYPKKKYRKDSAGFERIKAEVEKMRPLTSEQAAQQQQQQGSVGQISWDDIKPSGHVRTLDHSAYQIAYPDNWQVFGDNNAAVTIAPRAGVTQNAVAYGVIINAFRPQSGSTLDQATQDLIDSLRRTNPGMQVAGQAQNVTVDGVTGRALHLSAKSPISGQNERDLLVTVPRNDNSVLFLVFISPERDFSQLRGTYEQMLQNLRIK